MMLQLLRKAERKSEEAKTKRKRLKLVRKTRRTKRRNLWKLN